MFCIINIHELASSMIWILSIYVKYYCQANYSSLEHTIGLIWVFL